MNYEIIIRKALPTDIAQLVQLCAAHAAFEQASYDYTGKEGSLSRDLFSPSPKLHCLVAVAGEKLIGYATFMVQYATWTASEYIYMDCLFVDEYARGNGLGEQLIDHIKQCGSDMGCSLIQWQTPDFNTRAMKFYKRIGATSLSKERFFLNIESL